MNVFNDLEIRGLVKQTTNLKKIRALLNNQKITFYIGFDPTADSLHVGHLLQIITAKRLIDAGHTCIMLIGGATATIGDPTGKSDMRKMLSLEEVNTNYSSIETQIRKLAGEKIHLINNIAWFGDVRFLEMIRNIAPHFSVNNMLRAECFKSRMENCLSFMEFNYMIMQATDFLKLFEKYNCVLQIGGNDQWSNILAGIDLIHKTNNVEVFGLTIPLLVNSNGQKMGKTEKGAVWLDADKTSPFDFFQFWRNIPDDQVEKCINFFTNLSWNEIKDTDINKQKKILAEFITEFVHGKNEAIKVLDQVQSLFELKDASKMEVVEITEGVELIDLLVQIGFAKSKTDARNLINNKGIYINNVVVNNLFVTLCEGQFGKEIIIRKGKKNFAKCLIKNGKR